MDKKIGVYLCSGCGIGDALDMEKLAKVARSEYKIPACQVHPYLCGAEGLALIRKDMEEQGVNALVIGACSPRVKTEAFAFDPKMVFDRVNLREHVAWCHKPKDEDTQMLAEDYLRMGIVKAQKSEPLEPVAEEVSKTILVVGGGVAGITAALESAAAGYEVVLVEKQAQLGGFVATFRQGYPQAPPYVGLTPEGMAEKIQEVLYHPKVKVYTSARIKETSGQPGMFDVTE